MIYKDLYLKTIYDKKDLSTDVPNITKNDITYSNLSYNTSTKSLVALKEIAKDSGIQVEWKFPTGSEYLCRNVSVVIELSKVVNIEYNIYVYYSLIDNPAVPLYYNLPKNIPLLIDDNNSTFNNFFYVEAIGILLSFKDKASIGDIAKLINISLETVPTQKWTEQLPVVSPDVALNTNAISIQDLENVQFTRDVTLAIYNTTSPKSIDVNHDLSYIWVKFVSVKLEENKVTIKYNDGKPDTYLYTGDYKGDHIVEYVGDRLINVKSIEFKASEADSTSTGIWSLRDYGEVSGYDINKAGTTLNNFLGHKYRFILRNICSGDIRIASSDWKDDLSPIDTSLNINVKSKQKVLVFSVSQDKGKGKKFTYKKFIYYRDPNPGTNEGDVEKEVKDKKGKKVINYSKLYSFRNNDEVIFVPNLNNVYGSWNEADEAVPEGSGISKLPDTVDYICSVYNFDGTRKINGTGKGAIPYLLAYVDFG